MMDRSLEGRHDAAGYLMITSLSIKNFRGFEKVDLQNLKRINVVVGLNSSGKTALGEALYLAASASPLSNYLFRQIRNRLLPSQPPVWDRKMFEAFWKDLFFDFDPNLGTELSFVDSEKAKYVVKIFYREEKAPPQPVSGPLPSAPATPLVFQRRGPKGTTENRVFLEKNVPAFDGQFELIPTIFALSAAGQFGQGDIVNWYSDLTTQGSEGIVLKYLKRVFPEIDALSIALDVTLPALYAKVRSVRELLPIGVVSAGISKFLGALLAISAAKKGIVLIDEIDNGLHYKRLPDVWSCLFDFCEEREVQLFAATHSWEALKAIDAVLSNNLEKFSYLRTERDNRKCAVYQFTGQQLKATLDENIDPRGGE